MKNVVRLGGLLALALTGSVVAGTIDAGLEARLESMPAAERVSVLVFLRGQVDVGVLDAQFDAQRTPLVARHETVVCALQTQAEITQGPLDEYLRGLADDGQVANVRAY